LVYSAVVYRPYCVVSGKWFRPKKGPRDAAAWGWGTQVSQTDYVMAREELKALDVRKATLRSLLIKTGPGLRWNEHIEGDGETIFRHACKLGLEGIVSKRKDSPYRSGRSPDWLKMKNPQHLR
jgi:hypothetical protein